MADMCGDSGFRQSHVCRELREVAVLEREGSRGGTVPVRRLRVDIPCVFIAFKREQICAHDVKLRV